MTSEPRVTSPEAAPAPGPAEGPEALPDAAPEPESNRSQVEEEERRRVEIQGALTALAATDDLQSQAHQQAGHIKALPPDQQLKVLATLAFERGTVFAVTVAQKLGNLGILDELHDYLVRDDVYPHLDIVKRKH